MYARDFILQRRNSDTMNRPAVSSWILFECKYKKNPSNLQIFLKFFTPCGTWFSHLRQTRLSFVSNGAVVCVKRGRRLRQTRASFASNESVICVKRERRLTQITRHFCTMFVTYCISIRCKTANKSQRIFIIVNKYRYPVSGEQDDESLQ